MINSELVKAILKNYMMECGINYAMNRQYMVWKKIVWNINSLHIDKFTLKAGDLL